MQKTLQNLLRASLFLVVCSGIYGIMVGIRYTNEYLYLTEGLRNQAGSVMTAGTLLLNYFSGAFRGIVTIIFGMAGLICIRKKDIKTWYCVSSGILTFLYVFGWKRFPYTEELVQMLIAVLSFALLIACRYLQGSVLRKERE